MTTPDPNAYWTKERLTELFETTRTASSEITEQYEKLERARRLRLHEGLHEHQSRIADATRSELANYENSLQALEKAEAAAAAVGIVLPSRWSIPYAVVKWLLYGLPLAIAVWLVSGFFVGWSTAWTWLFRQFGWSGVAALVGAVLALFVIAAWLSTRIDSLRNDARRRELEARNVDALKGEVRAAKEELLHAGGQAALRVWRSQIANEMKPLYSVAMNASRSTADDVGSEREMQVMTPSHERLAAKLVDMRGGSIGIAGPRGAGKSTLMTWFCSNEAAITGKRPTLAVPLSAPVDYQTRDFLLHLFASLCHRTLEQSDKQHTPHAWKKRFTQAPVQNGDVLQLVFKLAFAAMLVGAVLALSSLFWAISAALPFGNARSAISKAGTPVAPGSSAVAAKAPLLPASPVGSAASGPEGIVAATLPPSSAVASDAASATPSIDNSPSAPAAASAVVAVPALGPESAPASIPTPAPPGVASAASTAASTASSPASSGAMLTVAKELGLTPALLLAVSLPMLLGSGVLIALLSTLARRNTRAAEVKDDQDQFELDLGQMRRRRTVFDFPFGWYREVLAGLQPLKTERPSTSPAEIAFQWLAEIKFQQSYSTGWSGALKMPGGIEGGVNQARSLAQQQLSLPEIADAITGFLRILARKYTVVVGIDELDKIESDEKAQKFLNDIKVVFGGANVFFLVSVSENAMSHFERRGLPFRDAFDSAFDDIVVVNNLDFEFAQRLINERVLRMPRQFQALCHVLSSGLPRELVRTTRDLVLAIKRSKSPEERELGRITQSLVVDELEAKVLAYTAAAGRLPATPQRDAFLLLLDQAVSGPTTSERLFQLHLDLLLQFAKPGAAGSNDKVTELSGFEALADEVATYLYFLSVVCHVFVNSLDAIAMQKFESGKLFDTLARVRSVQERNQALARGMLDKFVQQLEWSTPYVSRASEP